MSGSKEFEALGLQEVPSEGDGRETSSLRTGPSPLQET